MFLIDFLPLTEMWIHHMVIVNNNTSLHFYFQFLNRLLLFLFHDLVLILWFFFKFFFRWVQLVKDSCPVFRFRFHYYLVLTNLVEAITVRPAARFTSLKAHSKFRENLWRLFLRLFGLIKKLTFWYFLLESCLFCLNHRTSSLFSDYFNKFIRIAFTE